MTQRVYNFSAGPAVLPEPVLATAQRDLMALPGVGASILEISHRSQQFGEILSAAETNLRSLLAIPDNYAVLFLQGGSRLQFSMVPMNLLTPEQPSAAYLISGAWGKHAYQEALKSGSMQILWDGDNSHYDRLPKAFDPQVDPNAAYLHYTSNETIQGVQFATDPNTHFGTFVWGCPHQSHIGIVVVKLPAGQMCGYRIRGPKVDHVQCANRSNIRQVCRCDHIQSDVQCW